jgi:hypothetical protein
MFRFRARTRLAVLLVVLVVGALVLAACGGGDDDDSEAEGDEEVATTSTTEEPATTTTLPPVIAPLTGLPDATGTSPTRAAVVVKVDNVPGDGRPPQAGIEIADVVYEEPVEGTTRLAAVFHSTIPPRVGPVRSTRFLDPGIVWPIGGMYVYSGGTADKVAAIKASPMQTVDENGLQQAGARQRDSQFRAPHNLFALMEPLLAWDQVQSHTPPPALFTFLAGGQPFNGTPASKIEINNDTNAEYTWDAASGRWQRSALIDATGQVKPHLAESGTQIAPANVIVQKIGGVNDKAQLVGNGQAWVCTQGKCTAATWRRSDLGGVTEFVDANGAVLALTPGSTWVHLNIGDDPTITP